MTSCTKHFKKWLMLLATILIVQVAAKAQFTATSGAVMANPDLAYTVCGNAETDTMYLKNTNSTSASAISFILHLLPGGSYVAGSMIGATESNISNLHDAVFTIAGPIAPNNTVKIAYKKTFTCPVIAYQATGGITRDSLDITYTGGGPDIGVKGSPTYAVVSALLSVSSGSPNTYTGLPGDNFTQTITITNGGLGCTTTAFLALTGTASGLNISNPSKGTLNATNDTIFFAAGDMPGGDGKWCTNETLTLTFKVTLNNCSNLLRNLTAGWGCGGNVCPQIPAPNSFPVSAATNIGVPNVVQTASVWTPPNCMPNDYGVVTQTFTNNGTGNAKINTVTINGDYGGTATTVALTIDTNTIKITGPAGVYDPITNNVLLNWGVNPASCLFNTPNVVNDIEIKNPNGSDMILAPGQSFTITYHIKFCVEAACANYEKYKGAMGAWVKYQNLCSQQMTTLGEIVINSQNYSNITSFSMPAQVTQGDCFKVKYMANFSNFGYTQAANATVQLVIPLPTGFTYQAGSLTYLTGAVAPISVTQVGSNLNIVYPSTIDNVGLGGSVVICTAPPACGVQTFNAYTQILSSATCGSVELSHICKSASIEVLCPSPCPSGGGVAVKQITSRYNFGLAGACLPTGGVLDTANTASEVFLPRDTLTTYMKYVVAAQTSPATINSWAYTGANQTFSNGHWTPVGTTTITVKRAGVTTTITGNVTNPSGDNKTFEVDWAAGAAALLPYLPGDSIFVKQLYRNDENCVEQSVNIGAPNAGNLTQYIYASTTVNPANTGTGNSGPRFRCNDFKYNYTLTGVRCFITPDRAPFSVTGCTSTYIYNHFYSYFDSYSCNSFFSKESRPIFQIDTVFATIPAGYSFDLTQDIGVVDNIATPTPTLVFSPAYYSITGNKIALYVSKYYKDNNITIHSEGGVSQAFFKVLPTCAAVQGTANILFEFKGINLLENPYPQNSLVGCLSNSQDNFGGSKTFDLIQNFPISYDGKPNINVAAPTPEVNTNTGQACWTVNINNTTIYDANNTFFKVVNANSLTNIVVKDAANTVIAADANGFYHLGSTVGSAFNTYTICANLNSCSKDSIQIGYGWDCVAYPTSWATAPCQNTIYLKAVGFLAGLDATFNRVGTGDVTLCSPPFTVEALINSTSVGNLGSDTLRVLLPKFSNYVAGSTFVGEYPAGTPYTASAYNPTIKPGPTGDTLIFALNNVTGGMGLTGIGDVAHKQVKIKFDIATQCGFASGAPVQATVSGVSVCGARTAVVNKSTNGITLVGANPATQYTLNYTATTNPCVAIATISVINSGTVPSVSADTLVITLPNGATLGAGAITAIKNFTSGTAPTNVNAATFTYKWPVTPGIAVGDSMKFSFPIDLTQTACGPQISTANVIENVILTCFGANCSTPVITATKIATIQVEKPTLVITNIVTQNINGWPSGGSGTLAVTLTNTSTVDVPASTYNVEYFCGSSTTPMAAALFPAAVPAGATVTANMTVIASSACLPGTTVTGKIRPVGVFGPVCLCNETSFLMTTVLPVNLLNLNASKLSTSQVKIGWQVGVELNLASYDVERSTDGSTFNKVNNTAATGRTNYSSLDNIAGVSSKNVYYRLKMINKDGTFKYSQIVKVNTEFTDMGMVIYPNPVRNQMLVTINSGITQKAELRLVNNLGQTLQTQQLNLVTGSNSVTVDNINRLPAAAYLVVVYLSNGDVQRAKVIKE